MDIHNYDKRLQSILKSLEESTLSTKNKKLLYDFHNTCFSEEIGKPKIVRYLFDLKKIAEIIKKDLNKCNRTNIEHILAEIEKSKYAYETKRGFRIVLKKFYKWLRKTDDDYPPEVKWIKTTAIRAKEKLPDELLMDEDIIKLIMNATKDRDKALISVLYDSGCRIGELLTIKIKHVVYDQYGAIITVNGKTGQRGVRLVPSAVYLKDWLNKHPDNENPEAYVWVSVKRKKDSKETIQLLGYKATVKMLKECAMRAKVTKKVNPHSFRHASATDAARRGLMEATMKKRFGWTPGSKSPEIYIHLSNVDVDKKVLQMHGIQAEDKKESIITLKKCPHCRFSQNLPTALYCNQCNMILDKEEATRILKETEEKEKVAQIMNEIVKDPIFKELFKKRMNTKT